MASRYTETDKWADAWFVNLLPLEKLLFSYLCDNCNIAGIIEIIIPKWTIALKGRGNLTQEDIEGALKGLERGFIYSKDKDCLYLRTFLKHQKNLPINPNNPAHRGILKKFDDYAHKFDIEDVIEFIKGASKGLISPICNGNGISNGKKGGAGGNSLQKFEIRLPDDFDLQFIDPPLVDIFRLWVVYKQGSKNPFRTQMQVEAAYRELMVLAENDSRTAKKIIDQSISNGYLSLLQLKSANQVKPKVREQYIPHI